MVVDIADGSLAWGPGHTAAAVTPGARQRMAGRVAVRDRVIRSRD